MKMWTGATVHLLQIEKLGLDLEALMEDVQQAYLDASDKQYQSLIQSVIRRLYVEAPRGGIAGKSIASENSTIGGL